jgi:hypothetical protein
LNNNNPVKTNKPFDWTSLNLSEEIKDLILETIKNSDGLHGKVYPIILIDPTQNPMKAIGQTNALNTTISDGFTAAAKTTVAGISPVGTVGSGNNGIVSNSVLLVGNVSLNTLETVRTPTIFKSIQCNTAAATAIWTPAAGKKFRIMGGIITTSGWLAAAAETIVTLLDQAGAIGLAFNFVLPAAATALSACIPFDLKPNGYLSAAANNVLNATLSGNLTGGHVMVSVWGTEE